MMEADLDYIGATRQDRIIAEQVRRQHQGRLEWVVRWLGQFGWTFNELPNYLSREIPFLANRGGEALRAPVAACILDHDDIATLALSIEGLEEGPGPRRRSDPRPQNSPVGLPEPVLNLRGLWHPVHQRRHPVAGLFELPCFPLQAGQRRRISAIPAAIVAPSGVGSGSYSARGPRPLGDRPGQDAKRLLRTDLWSDQVLVLRAVQSLTMLDVQHNCELVWNLGGYTAAPEPEDRPDDDDGPRPEEQGVPTIPLAETEV